VKTDIVCIADIKTGTRHRKDMGDLDTLASSLRELGMLQPVGITPDKTLVFGERRMTAAKLLGWTQVPALVFESLTDAVAAIKAERDENRCRKEMTPSEYVELGRALEAVERAEAEKRQKSGAKSDLPDPGPEGSAAKKGDTRDKVGEALGISGKTYERAKIVVDEAPELVEAMDSGALPVRTAAKVAKLAPKERKKVAKAADPKKAAKQALAKEAVAQAHEEQNGDRDPEDPAPDQRFMPNAAEAAAFAEQFRNWIARIRAVRTEMRKALPDREHVMANRIDFGSFDAHLTELVDTLDRNVPEHVCPVCCGTGATEDAATCKFCDGYGIVDKGHHGGLKAKWKHTRARFEQLAGGEL